MKALFLLLPFFFFLLVRGQDYDDGDGSSTGKTAPSLPEKDTCNGIFLTYTLMTRVKEYPHVKNVSAQSWAFEAEAAVLNTGTEELKGWKLFVGFKHDEILVSADGAVVSTDGGAGGEFPVAVGNGTYLTGFPLSDLKTSIDTAGDLDLIQARVSMTGTTFGLKATASPMPKTIRLENDGYKCPATRMHGTNAMYVCCVTDPKHKVNKTKTLKYPPRQHGDLEFTYDVIQAFAGNYLAQVTLDNTNPLGRLDHWNLTWEWTRGEFIFAMRGAYTHRHDSSSCIYGPAGAYYKDLDFSQVMNCDKHPIISDLPADRAQDEKVGKLPFCCRNGTLLPPLMDKSKARSIFQLEVYKTPPDVSNRTAFYPPQKWHVDGILNPDYKCGAPIQVDPTESPDPSGLQAVTVAVASWQVTCNITRPKAKKARCCVSFSAFYNDSVVPCNTCACGCPEREADTCDASAPSLLLPAEALLVPFSNRTENAKAWARLKRRSVPQKLPCADNCGVSINWHVNADFRKGWTARITLFNWMETAFEDWFTAVQIRKTFAGFENVYSFNGTRMPLNDTIFFQGLPGLNYLVAETNGTNYVRVPGKQQSVVSFSKKKTPGINIRHGDGFPTKVFFNGEECELPTNFPTSGSSRGSARGVLMILLQGLLVVVVSFVLVL